MRASIHKRFVAGCTYAVDLLRQHLPINAKDPDVITFAQSLNAVLLTLNGDFVNIINYPPARFGGIIALQVRNHPEVSTDKRSGITNDPNRADGPQYIVRLIGQVITVSVETVELVRSLASVQLTEAKLGR